MPGEAVPRGEGACRRLNGAAGSFGLNPTELCRTCPRHRLRQLLHPHPGDRSADHELLDLLSAFEDVVGPQVASTW